MRLEQIKSDAGYQQLQAWEQQFTDAAFLKRVTLGQLGSDIQFSIHNVLHMRWAAVSPIGYRSGGSLTHAVSTRWDQPAYNWLGGTYSSHVNPILWKIHGWVDNRIEDWKRANNVSGDGRNVDRPNEHDAYEAHGAC